ncbi:MAG: hypothetical protein ACOC2T_01925, partial [Planctomycetota bacterium]
SGDGIGRRMSPADGIGRKESGDKDRESSGVDFVFRRRQRKLRYSVQPGGLGSFHGNRKPWAGGGCHGSFPDYCLLFAGARPGSHRKRNRHRRQQFRAQIPAGFA